MSDNAERDEALEELIRLVQPDVEPELDLEEDVEKALDKNLRVVTWSANKALKYRQLVFPTVRTGLVYRVKIAGTTGATEPPTWPTGDGSTVVNGTVTFEEFGAYPHSIYNVNAAAKECWQIKMAKASEYFSGGRRGNENQIYDHCKSMRDSFDRPMVA